MFADIKVKGNTVKRNISDTTWTHMKRKVHKKASNQLPGEWLSPLSLLNCFLFSYINTTDMSHVVQYYKEN